MPSCISAIRYLKLSGIGATNIINTFRAIYWKVIIYITNVKLKDMLGWNIVSTETYNLCIVKNHTLTQLFVKYRCFGITKIIGSKALNSGFPSIQVKFQRYGRHVCYNLLGKSRWWQNDSMIKDQSHVGLIKWENLSHSSNIE
jgi:hypothetical protein